MADRIRTRFLVIGSGVAGLHTAWRASESGEVVVLTKRSLFDSATAYAQGGIAAALGAGDSPELHRRDTLAAGGALKLGREAAHSQNRIVHAHGDQTGAEVARTLVEKVRAAERVRVLERARVLELIVEDGACVGARVSWAGRATDIVADATVLATGGCGGGFKKKTKPPPATRGG